MTSKISPEDGLGAALDALAAAAADIKAAQLAYDRALLGARAAGASWAQMGQAGAEPAGTVRSRHRVLTGHRRPDLPSPAAPAARASIPPVPRRPV